MKLGHLLLRSVPRSVDLHLFVEAVVEQKVVCHPDAVWLHRMTVAVVVVAHIPCMAESEMGVMRKKTHHTPSGHERVGLNPEEEESNQRHAG